MLKVLYRGLFMHFEFFSFVGINLPFVFLLIFLYTNPFTTEHSVIIFIERLVVEVH